ncbi:hypothetical protein PVAND_005532 [Polypedilum vanderplanki]|uniref:EGF-like domain-containing protein n=1 Tax=Polypedilum vanderplanki TaxID=319348 RepID=A0A9J6C0G6_POLVA|nr:hypothetical protein PVAND_005532 [Polypedilum vanderplanki]
MWLKRKLSMDYNFLVFYFIILIICGLINTSFAFLSCNPSPCKNGGQCITKSKTEAYCNCTSRYVGDFCQYTNPCLTAPRCQNGGTCEVIIKDNQSTFECKCPMGFSASLCEISESTACSSSPCKNNGECILRSLDEYECKCPEGFSGRNCEKSNLCASSPCKNGGRCSMTLNNKYKCTCPPGFKGQNCTEDIKECLNNPCKNGGTCIESFGSYK